MEDASLASSSSSRNKLSIVNRSNSVASGYQKQETEHEQPAPRRLGCILEDPNNPTEVRFKNKGGAPLTEAQKKRANLVKKCIKYFGNKNNRSTSEDNLLTRRKNLAVHLGLDESVGISEVQKINRRCLPVPNTTVDSDDGSSSNELMNVEPPKEEEDVKSKNLVHYLGITDGMSAASISAQGTLSEGVTSANPSLLTHKDG